MPAFIGYRGTVYPWHCDHMGHMNVMWYVGKFDEAQWNLLASIGLTPSYLREQRRGMAAVEQTLRYERELQAGDIVEVEVAIVEVREKAMIVQATMRNAEHGHVAATMTLAVVHLDTVARKAIALPAQVAAAARRQAVSA